MKEGAAGSAATSFTWDVYAFGAQSDADASKVNLSNLTERQRLLQPRWPGVQPFDRRDVDPDR